MQMPSVLHHARPSCVALLLALSVPCRVTEGQATDLLERHTMISSQVRRSTLPNGLRLSLLPSEDIEGPVAATFVLRYGNETSRTGRAVDAQWLGFLANAGIPSLGQDSLAAAFERLGADITFYGRERDILVQLTARRAQLIPTLDLTLRVLRLANYPDSQVKESVGYQIQSLASEQRSPGKVGEIELRRRLMPYPSGHPLETRTLSADSAALAAVTGARLRELHGRLVGATDGDLVVTGDFEPASVIAWAARSLGTWRSNTPPARVAHRQFNAPVSEGALPMPAGVTDGALLLGMQLSLAPNHPDFVTLQIANMVLGDMVLSNNRLSTRLVRPRRVAMTAFSWIEGALGDSVSLFIVKAVGRRDSMPRVEAVVREELERLLRDGITEPELLAAKRQWLDLQRYQLSETPQVATFLADEGRARSTGTDFARSVQQVDALTAEQAIAAVRRHIDLTRLVTVRVNMPSANEKP